MGLNKQIDIQIKREREGDKGVSGLEGVKETQIYQGLMVQSERERVKGLECGSNRKIEVGGQEFRERERFKVTGLEGEI